MILITLLCQIENDVKPYLPYCSDKSKVTDQYKKTVNYNSICYTFYYVQCKQRILVVTSRLLIGKGAEHAHTLLNSYL